MHLQPLSERIGALVNGIDLASPYSAEDERKLREAMRDHRLLLFREADLMAEDQIRLVGVFADVWDEKGDGTRHIFVSNSVEGAVLGRPDGLLFHSDCIYMPAPLAVLSLYAMEMPASPSPTLFASSVTVVNDLPPDLRARLEGAGGLYVGGLGGYERLRDTTAPDNAKRVEHPVLYPDPLAGRPALIVDELYFDHFIGWDIEESDGTRAEIHRHLFADRNTYLHNWQVGDLLVWDNVALQHARKPVPEDGRRTLRRVVGLDPSVTDYEHLTVKALEIEAVRGR
jgi:taurine dioxygenase